MRTLTLITFVLCLGALACGPAVDENGYTIATCGDVNENGKTIRRDLCPDGWTCCATTPGGACKGGSKGRCAKRDWIPRRPTCETAHATALDCLATCKDPDGKSNHYVKCVPIDCNGAKMYSCMAPKCWTSYDCPLGGSTQICIDGECGGIK